MVDLMPAAMRKLRRSRRASNARGPSTLIVQAKVGRLSGPFPGRVRPGKMVVLWTSPGIRSLTSHIWLGGRYERDD